ncbi:hypothetical protein LguiA_016633 [Lonicera macranthoides]
MEMGKRCNGNEENSRIKGSDQKAIKVKYISSPVTVRARDASEFRSIVQQLTGHNSQNNINHDDVNYIQTTTEVAVHNAEDYKCISSTTKASSVEFNEDLLFG